MGKLVHRYKDEKIRLSSNEVADTETGEIINIGNSTLFKRTGTNEITINSKEYIYVDSENLNKLIRSGIKQVDLALLFSLSSNILIFDNICIDKNGEPLKTSTIAVLIGNTIQPTKRKINRLIELGLLYYGIYQRKKLLGKVYIMNPYVIRKGRKSSIELSWLFNDIE